MDSKITAGGRARGAPRDKGEDSDRSISASNFLHQTDQAFRRIVSQTMQKVQGNVPVNERKVLAQELRLLKEGFLENLRHRSSKETHDFLHIDVAMSDAAIAFQERADYIFRQHTKFCKKSSET